MKITNPYPILIILILTIIFFYKPIFLGHHLLGGDIIQNAIFYSPSPLTLTQGTAPHNYLLGDTLTFFYPFRFLLHQAWSQGQIPTQNPYILSGTSFIGNGHAAVFYPLHIIYLILPIGTASTYSIILHLFLGGLFMYLFLKNLKLNEFSSLIGAIVFMFNGFSIIWLEFLNLMNVWIWLPLILLLFDKSIEKFSKSMESWHYILLTGGAIGIQFLANHIQTSFYILLAFTFYALFRGVTDKRPIRGTASHPYHLFIICMTLGLLIGAVQIIPQYELFSQTDRHWDLKEVMRLAIPPHEIIRAIMPDFFGNDVGGTHFGYTDSINGGNLYVGILPLILTFFAVFANRNKHVVFFSLLSVFTLLMSFRTPLTPLFYSFGLTMFAAVSRMLILYVFSLSVLAAFGCDALIHLKEENKGILVKFIKILCLILVFTIVIYTVATFNKDIIISTGYSLIHTIKGGLPHLQEMFTPSELLEYLTTTVENIYYLELNNLFVFYVLIAGCILLFTTLKVDGLSKIVLSLLLIIVVADLFYFGYNFNTTVEPGTYLQETPTIKFLKNDTDLFRIIRYGDTRILAPNTPMIYGLYDVQGYDPLHDKEYREFIRRIDPQMVHSKKMIDNMKDPDALNSPLLDVLHVKYVLTADVIDNERWRLVFNESTTAFGEDVDILTYLNEDYRCPGGDEFENW